MVDRVFINSLLENSTCPNVVPDFVTSNDILPYFITKKYRNDLKNIGKRKKPFQL